ncbi:hypothetical protein M440DRAFT_1441756 [Trichoderma longibrachiatum ATCC 18648]|uniref:Zn(2)-C6 fungal-type domain-containing protein n=1 Tax=Trichoderma longibrachiatum ATCC 18648 TaxID=983965 RepID=A0A2T4BUH3_TRILO|nr:hypothetical protein M440DRAFT_1441756 [Trichoderma longibrachiatum ATCC 18648]
MAPTPPSAGSPSHDERTRRNVACVNCRNSKVRCRSSQVPGQPCQRCAKLDISCVVDKTHKRITKRSKLEQLEQELRSIQKVVNTKTVANSESAWSPPSPLTAFSAAPSTSDQATPSTAAKPARPPLSIQLQGPPPRPPDKRQTKTGPTEARVLDSLIISGQDVDYYFSKYLQHFHPFLPILRRKDPDECFHAQPTLFWAVLYVAARRYARDAHVFGALVAHMTKSLWAMISGAVLGVDEIHAVLLVCAWPYPTIRFVTDPSSMLASIAMNACVSLGLHTGRGSHPQFCVGSRTSAAAGHPPPFIQHTDARCRAALGSNYWTDLVATYDLQRFLNRFHMAMHAQTSTVGSVQDSAVAAWETEFEMLKPAMIRFETEITRILTLAAQLEMQLFYFMSPSSITPSNNNLTTNPAFTTTAANPPPQPHTSSSSSSPSPNPPSAPPPAQQQQQQQQQQQTPSSNPSLHINALKAFSTARSLILTALDLDARSKFITHCPGLLCRALTDAANTIVYLLHSHWGPPVSSSSSSSDNPNPNNNTSSSYSTVLTPEEASTLAQQSYTAILRCSVKESDIWYRASVILETFWSFRAYVPKFDSVPPSWVSRGGAGITYACLEKFKNGLLTAQKSTDGVDKCLEIIQFRTDQASGMNTAVQHQPVTNNVPASDPFQDVDWSMFMDDFGWTGEDGVLMSLI